MVGGGDYIGGNLAQLFYPGNGTVTISGQADSVAVNVSGGTFGKSFTLNVAAPPSQSLAVGTYEDAQRAAFRTAGHAGLDVYGDGRGCNEVVGRFTVRDIGVDGSGNVNKFWVTYEQHCEGATPALIGEIRINEPGGDSDVLVADGAIDWPESYPGVNGMTVPVWLVNTGSSPLHVTSTSFTGSNPADFAELSNSCSSDIAHDAICVIQTRFTPTAPGGRSATLVLSDTTSAGTHQVSLSGRGIDGHTAFYMHSESGDYIGAGKNYAYDPTNASIGASGSTNFVSMAVSSGPDNWSAQFKAPNGQVLAPGTYSGATRYPFQGGGAGLNVDGDGRGCNTLTGTFTVIEAVYEGGTGPLQRFSATFEQHCEGGTPALFGWVSYRATNANVPPPVASPVTGLNAYPTIGSALIQWTNPNQMDYIETIVRAQESLTPPTISQGIEVYRGTGQGVVLDYLTPGQSYSVSVWTRDSSNDLSTPATLTLRGSDLALTASASVIIWGNPVTFTGTLSDGSSGASVSGQDIDIYIRNHGASAYSYFDTLTTSSAGKISFTLRPNVSIDLQLSYHGRGLRIGTTSSVAYVGVRWKVVASLSPTTIARNHTATIKGYVSPNASGQTIYLQRYYSGAWHTVASTTLGSTSGYSFGVHPTTAGKYLYRVYKPGDSRHLYAVTGTMTLTAT